MISHFDPRRAMALEGAEEQSRLGYSSVQPQIRHQYNLPPRRSGNIYNGETYIKQSIENGRDPSIIAVPPPPSSWAGYGYKLDKNNGTLHFPQNMPAHVEDDIASHTIKRDKLSWLQLLMFAAQLEYYRLLGYDDLSNFMDSTLTYMRDILRGDRPFDTQKLSPRKITQAQTLELLYAWVRVYVQQEDKYRKVLHYYLMAGYTVSITHKRGGTHEK